MTILRKLTYDKITFKAMVCGKVVGCAVLNLPRKKNPRAFLSWLEVKPSWRQRGIGERLVHAAVVFAQENGMKGETYASPVPYSEEWQKKLYAWYLKIGLKPYNPSGYQRNQFLKF